MTKFLKPGGFADVGRLANIVQRNPRTPRLMSTAHLEATMAKLAAHRTHRNRTTTGGRTTAQRSPIAVEDPTEELSTTRQGKLVSEKGTRSEKATGKGSAADDH
ncbi:MAG: hypothetical protein R2939_22985, partial [Kofleriaceae bacterium]